MLAQREAGFTAWKRWIPTAALAAALAFLPAAAASADTGPQGKPGTGEEAQTTVRMTITDIDEKVAEANGFKVLINDAGVKRSIPVTDAAKAIVAESAARTGNVSPQGTVGGDCGTSTITGNKVSGDWVNIYTAYAVYAPVTHRNWQVVASGFITGFTYVWPSASTGPSWNATVGGTAVGPGTAFVPAFIANVVLTDGAVCYSWGPSFGFP